MPNEPKQRPRMIFFFLLLPPPTSPLFPYTTLFRSHAARSPREPDRALRRGRARLGERDRSEEHTSELQSHHDLVCRLLLEKKNKKTRKRIPQVPRISAAPLRSHVDSGRLCEAMRP